MVKLGLNEKGESIGVLGIITLVILVVILVVAGFFAYKHFHNNSSIVKNNVSTTTVPNPTTSTADTNSSATNQSQTSTTTVPNPTTSTATESSTGQSVVKITQLGVEMTVPNSIDDLIYYESTVTKTSPTATTAVLSTQALSKLDPACGVDSTKTIATLQGIGTLYEYQGTYTATTNPDKTSVWSKQFPSFYVAYNTPASACSKTAATNTVAQTQATTLKTALASMTTVAATD